jgi:hypothetical protein
VVAVEVVVDAVVIAVTVVLEVTVETKVIVTPTGIIIAATNENTNELKTTENVREIANTTKRKSAITTGITRRQGGPRKHEKSNAISSTSLMSSLR